MGGISGKKRGKIMITIRLKDGKELHFENEVTLFEAAKKISNSLAKDVLVAKVDGELTDIRNNITDGTLPKQIRRGFLHFGIQPLM